MKPDPLRVLLRLREAELDEASRQVGAALQLEIAAEAARAAAADAIARESDAVLLSDADTDVERFAGWLRHARARLRTLEQALADAVFNTTALRAELALVRGRAKAVADAVERREDAVRRQRLRVEQIGHDEQGQGAALDPLGPRAPDPPGFGVP